MSEIKLLQEINELKKLIKQNYINEKPVLTAKELQVYLDFSESKLNKLTANKLIPFYKPTNGARIFKKDEIHEWIMQYGVHSESDADKIYQSYNKKRKSK